MLESPRNGNMGAYDINFAFLGHLQLDLQMNIDNESIINAHALQSAARGDSDRAIIYRPICMGIYMN